MGKKAENQPAYTRCTYFKKKFLVKFDHCKTFECYVHSSMTCTLYKFKR